MGSLGMAVRIGLFPMVPLVWVACSSTCGREHEN